MVHKARKQILNRLSRIEGHIRGISKMVENDRDCSDILLQITATQAAIKKVAKLVLEDHIDTCVLESVEDGSIEQELQELKASLATLL